MMGQELYMYITLGVILLFLIGFFIISRIRKKRLKKQFNVPTETLQQFNEIERRYLGNKDGNSNPYEILWKFTRESRDTGRIGGIEKIDGAAGIREQPIQRNDIQSGTSIQHKQEHDGTEKTGGSSNRRLKGLFRRRN